MLLFNNLLKFNNKGYVSVTLCLLLPLIIVLLGFCIDGNSVIYYQARLMAATKNAAISATTYYLIEDNDIIISSSEDFVISSVEENFSEATLVSFTVDKEKRNTCTVETEVEVPFYFAKIFGVESKLLKESYTAKREVTENKGD